MLRATFQNIVDNIDVRKNLITLKELLREDTTKNSHNKEALLYVMAGDYQVFLDLLKHEDAKVRKNTALIMGELAVSAFLHPLYEAFLQESQMFVKDSYLAAMKNLEYDELLPEMTEEYEKLRASEVTEENKKHITAILRVLEELIRDAAPVRKHKFTGYEAVNEIVLLCNRNHIHVTMEQLGKLPKKEFTAGVLLKTRNLMEVLPIRTYRELLFAVSDLKTVPNDVVSAAKLLADGSILKFLQERHSPDGAFYFRLEVKSKMDTEKKTAFIKRLSSEIEHLSDRKLLNSTNRYEFEIRLIENKEGRYNVLLRLYTLADKRFAYRKEVIAASIHPANAALCVELARPYLSEEAQVLDPFCGVGTMLIERNYALKAKTMYGIDIFGEAIDKARVNTKEADMLVNYINRDFFDFKHDYLFDEIITNMPSVSRSMPERELFDLYRRFFEKAKEHLKEHAVMVLYTHHRDYVRKLANTAPYHIEKEFEISMMEGTYVYIIRYEETSR